MTATPEPYREAIVDYYDQCEVDYRMLWRLDRCLALHYGYWDETTSTVSEALIRENQVLAERAAITAGDRVLDAGCGVGGSAIHLAHEHGCEVVGITLSEHQAESAAVNACREGVRDLTTFEVRDFNDTGYEDESFDVVWAVEAVCHARDKADFVSEAYRILRPGGRLVLADFFASRGEYSEAEQKLLDEWLSGWSVEALEWGERFQRHLADAGFTDIDYRDETEHARPSAHRLYRYAVMARWIGKILKLLRLRSPRQDANITAVYRQWQALQQGLWHYGMVTARKP